MTSETTFGKILMRGFTLKQLIAITTIVSGSALILVPNVAAQGGTKGDAKSWYLGQLHQYGTAFTLYANDFDDALPLAMFRRPENGNWAVGSLVPSPADCISTAPWQTPARIAVAQTVWRNSLAPYAGSASLVLPGAPEYTLAGETFAGTPNLTNAMMNGLLHSHNVNAVNAPALVPMLWTAVGRTNLKGRFFSNPSLQCSSSPACRFDPNGPPDPTNPGTNSSVFVLDFTIPVWIYGQNAPVVRVDTSVAVKPIGTKIVPDFVDFSNALLDPWAQVNNGGGPNTIWNCGPGHTAATPNAGTSANAYTCYFRPDRTE